MVLGECGRLPLSISYMTNCIRYFCKLLTMPSSTYPKQCYFILKSLDDVGRICWVTKVKHVLFRYGFGFVWISQEIGDTNMFLKLFKQRLIDCCTQQWYENITNSSRCFHYNKFKSLLNVERYLLIEIPFKHKKAFCNFRCSNHKLGIEIGRHNNIPREERLCTTCNDSIDCEFHAFFICKKYKQIRDKYLFNWYFGGKELHDFYVLIGTRDIITLRKLMFYVYVLMDNINN